MSDYNLNGITYTNMNCGECGIVFYVPKAFDNEQLRLGPEGSWSCPNGHTRHYTRSTKQKSDDRLELNRLKQKLAQKDDAIKAERERADRERESKNAARRSARAYKGQATKLKNRAKAGVCPCCNRTFQNLKKHMDGQHPEFELEKVEEVEA